eukprot:gene15075-4496_t
MGKYNKKYPASPQQRGYSFIRFICYHLFVKKRKKRRCDNPTCYIGTVNSRTQIPHTRKICQRKFL